MKFTSVFLRFSPLTPTPVYFTALSAISQNHILAFRLISFLPGSQWFHFISAQHKKINSQQFESCLRSNVK